MHLGFVAPMTAFSMVDESESVCLQEGDEANRPVERGFLWRWWRRAEKERWRERRGEEGQGKDGRRKGVVCGGSFLRSCSRSESKSKEQLSRRIRPHDGDNFGRNPPKCKRPLHLSKRNFTFGGCHQLCVVSFHLLSPAAGLLNTYHISIVPVTIH